MPQPFLAAGSLDRRIEIERQIVTTDEYGQERGDWQVIAKVWAAMINGSGAERRAAAQTQAQVAATFRIRFGSVTATVSPRDRIRFDPFDSRNPDPPIWNVTNVAPFGRRLALDVTAVRQNDG